METTIDKETLEIVQKPEGASITIRTYNPKDDSWTSRMTDIPKKEWDRLKEELAK